MRIVENYGWIDLDPSGVSKLERRAVARPDGHQVTHVARRLAKEVKIGFVSELCQMPRNLVRFLVEGGESATVRGELQGIESALQGLRLELAGFEGMPSVPPRLHPTWMRAKLEGLDDLLR